MEIRGSNPLGGTSPHGAGDARDMWLARARPAASRATLVPCTGPRRADAVLGRTGPGGLGGHRRRDRARGPALHGTARRILRGPGAGGQRLRGPRRRLRSPPCVRRVPRVRGLRASVGGCLPRGRRRDPNGSREPTVPRRAGTGSCAAISPATRGPSLPTSGRRWLPAGRATWSSIGSRASSRRSMGSRWTRDAPRSLSPSGSTRRRLAGKGGGAVSHRACRWSRKRSG